MCCEHHHYTKVVCMRRGIAHIMSRLGRHSGFIRADLGHVLPIESLAIQGQLFVICRGQSEGMATARVLHRLALGEGSVGLGVGATCLCSKKHFPAFKPERFGNSLDLACGGGAPALKDVAESRELHPRQAR